jgi:hypothetical protein
LPQTFWFFDLYRDDHKILWWEMRLTMKCA